MFKDEAFIMLDLAGDRRDSGWEQNLDLRQLDHLYCFISGRGWRTLRGSRCHLVPEFQDPQIFQLYVKFCYPTLSWIALTSNIQADLVAKSCDIATTLEPWRSFSSFWRRNCAVLVALGQNAATHTSVALQLNERVYSTRLKVALCAIERVPGVLIVFEVLWFVLSFPLGCIVSHHGSKVRR